MFCNRGIYHKGWSAVTKHRTPWEMGGAVMPAFDDDVWELYFGNADWTQAKDLSKENPDKLHELQRLWLIRAVKYNVLPLDDRQIERLNPTLAGRPALIKGNSQLLFAGMGWPVVGEQCGRHQEQVVRGARSWRYRPTGPKVWSSPRAADSGVGVCTPRPAAPSR